MPNVKNIKSSGNGSSPTKPEKTIFQQTSEKYRGFDLPPDPKVLRTMIHLYPPTNPERQRLAVELLGKLSQEGYGKCWPPPPTKEKCLEMLKDSEEFYKSVI